MDDGYRFRCWFVDNYGWARISLSFAIPALCSLPIFSATNNLSSILLYTLLPVYMIHQHEGHAHGRFVDFFNSTDGRQGLRSPDQNVCLLNRHPQGVGLFHGVVLTWPSTSISASLWCR